MLYLPFMSIFSDYLDSQQFCFLVEFIASSKKSQIQSAHLAGFPVIAAIADRVHSDEDLSPLQLAAELSENIEKMLHFSGKDRDIKDLNAFLQKAWQEKYLNILMLSGDKLKKHRFGNKQNALLRTRYLESVNAVTAAKAMHSEFNIGVAFNPFKYADAEKSAQYFKLEKKIKAGADYIITQLGYDLDALQQAKDFLKEHQYTTPILACVMPLTYRRAKFMLDNKIAGVVITSHMLKILQQEYRLDPGFAEKMVYERAALQIYIAKHLGYAGIHLSACHQADQQQKLILALDKFRCLTLNQCLKLWEELWQIQQGDELKYPVLQPVEASSGQIAKYKSMHAMHDLFFSSKIAKGVGGLVFNSKLWNKPKVADALLKTEFISKHRVVGCESCGQCRLGETLYICPETCPKGLANGPCGGTTLDRCEFGDHECIHSVKARLAKQLDETKMLRSEIIPTVPIEVRQTSSWKNWFSNE